MSDDDRELVMPFVCVQSAGGTYEDSPFVAGFQLGVLDAELATRRLGSRQAMVYAALLDQLDLIAMRYGYGLETRQVEYEWADVLLTRLDPDEARVP